jgi:FkbM family methyltransferase
LNTLRKLASALKRSLLGQSPAWFFATLAGERRLVPAKVSGVPIWVRSGTYDLPVALETLRHEYQAFFQKVPSLPGGLIVDAGAYIGTASIALARQYPNATVVAVEADAENFGILVRNTASWPNIKCIHAALTAEPGAVQIFDKGSGEWGFSIVAGDGPSRAVRNEVEGIPLVGIMARFGFDRIAILKLDIEGAERDVLSRSSEWIERTDAVFAELHEHLVPGCDAAWNGAVAGRRNGKLPGEKVYSFAS